MRRAAASTWFVAVVLVGAMAGTAIASPNDQVGDGGSTPPPPAFKGEGANVVEKLGAKVPLDAKFTTQDGQTTTLGDVLRGELPTILTFNYSECPMLCSLQLNGLMNVVPDLAKPARFEGPGSAPRDVAFAIGKQFRMVTISLEPGETLDRAKRMRERYIERFPEAQRDAARAGWTFLVANGDAAQIKRVADAVGFSYVYVTERAEWAHPAALIFLSAAGTVTRYVYGIEFEAQMMRESIIKAGVAEPTTASGFMFRCYHYDPSANDHSRAGMMALRIGAASFLLLMATCFGVYYVRRNSRRAGPGEAIS